MRDDRERLLDMLEAIERIDRYAVRGRAAFDRDELIQSWVIQQLQILGEAAARVNSGLRAAHPEVPWRQIIGMRNVLTHGYFEIDLDIVWSVVEHDLAALRSQLAAIVGRPD
jgi:uncharacterized protein with HEPN domain